MLKSELRLIFDESRLKLFRVEMFASGKTTPQHTGRTHLRIQFEAVFACCRDWHASAEHSVRLAVLYVPRSTVENVSGRASSRSMTFAEPQYLPTQRRRTSLSLQPIIQECNELLPKPSKAPG